MSAQPSVQQHPASVDAYIRHGWSLVPIPQGTKGPRTPGWNLKENALKSQSELPPGYGIGLAHSYSSTMALDIDDWQAATVALGLAGIDIKALYEAPDAVIIDSSRPGHGKLLYAMPFGITLPSKKVVQAGQVIYELRCATANGVTVQDVLPPSIHPDTGQPYRWAGRGNWQHPPIVPQPILDLWQTLIQKDVVRSIPSGTIAPASWDDIRSALEHISPDCTHDEWVTVGMALHWAGAHTDDMGHALSIWNEWSMNSTKYPSEKEILVKWGSFTTFKSNSVRIGTLFHMARERGWVRPAPDTTGLFGPITGMTLEMRLTSPKMDFSLWPAVLARRAKEIGRLSGCDPLIPLWAGLAAICGVIDTGSRLKLHHGHEVPPIIWTMIIGDPGVKKSPGSKPMFKILQQLEKEDLPRYSKDLLTWEGKEALFAATKKAHLDFHKDPLTMLSGDAAPPVAELPPKPNPLRVVINDITSQKMVRMCADQPRGLLCALDEMHSWFKKMTDKNSGEDRSAWVQSYEGSPYAMDRVGDGSIRCDNLAVSLYGNVQPSVFQSYLKALSDDGMIQRFIPTMLDSDYMERHEDIPEDQLNEAEWENVIRLTYALPKQHYTLSKEAYKVYRDFQTWYIQLIRDERLLQSSDITMKTLGKLEGLLGRIMFIWHVIEHPFSNQVNETTGVRAVKLIQTYVVPMYRYCFEELGGESSFDKWVREYILQHADKPTITMQKIRRDARNVLAGKNAFQQDQLVISAMIPLENIQWVIRIDDLSRESTHYAEWSINPQVANIFPDRRKELILAKQRRVDLGNAQRHGARRLVHGAAEYPDIMADLLPRPD